MPAMMLHGITLERDSRLSLRRQLAGHIESRILGGQIGPGRKLPSLRRAEELLGLHRNTVASAYRDLVRSGLVRTRPGSGVYVKRERHEGEATLPRVVRRPSGQLDLICADLDLKTVLEAELQKRLSIGVRTSLRTDEPGTAIRLAPSVGFLRWIRSLPTPSIVAVISSSERVHRLVSVAVLLHGGEGVGYLPVSLANRRSLDRATGLTSNVVADYASFPTARRLHSHDVALLPVISSLSYTALTTLTRGHAAHRRPDSRALRMPERSVRTGVREA